MNVLERDLVKIGTAASVVGVTTETLSRMAKRGDIPFHRTPGGQRLYDPRDLLELRERRARRAKRTGHRGGQPTTAAQLKAATVRMGAGGA